MDFLTVILLITVLITLFLLMGKLNRIEYLLRIKLQTPDQKQTSSDHSQQSPAPSPEPKTQITQSPAPPQKTVQPPAPNEPAAWSNFWKWFWMGSAKDNGQTSKEYAVATTWLIRAGVIVLLCGIGFFLKYSIENDLISPPVRISLTFLAGIAMFLGGIWGLGKRFHLISIGILSAGIVVLYMGSFAGYKLYSLLPAEMSFILMILTTVAAMLISVKKNLLPSALTGCAGAYLTPVLLSDGSGNLPFFLGYTAMISAGILIVSRERRWRSLEIMAFLFSFLLMISGSIDYSRKINWLCVLFLFLNFLVFSSIPVIRKKNTPPGKTEWLLPIFSAVITLLLGIWMLEQCFDSFNSSRLYAAGYAILISAVSLAEGFWLNRKHEHGAKMLPSFLCASIFALALSVPIALQNPGYVAAAWSILGFVLVLAAERSGLKTLLVLSGLLFFLIFLRIHTDGNNSYEYSERFFRGGVFSFALLGAAFLLRRHPYQDKIQAFPVSKICFAAVGGFAFLWYSSFEVYHNLKISDSLYHFRHGGLSLWWAILAVTLITWGIRKNLKEIRITGLILFVICLVKIYGVDISGLNTLGKVIAFLLLGILFLGGAAAYILFRKRFSTEEKQ